MEYITINEICTTFKSDLLVNKVQKNTGTYPLFGAKGIVTTIDSYQQDVQYISIIKWGAGVGRAELRPAYSSIVATMLGIMPNQNIDINWLCYLLQSLHLEQFATNAVVPNLYYKDFCNTRIKVPDICKQKEIAKQLNLILTVINDRKKQLQSLDTLIKARFVEMFGDPIRNTMKWDTYQLDDCLDRIDNGKSFVCSDKPRNGNFPAVLKLSAATYGDYRPSENKALLDETQFVENAEVHPGDLLFTRKNTPELVGMAAYVQETPSKLMMPDLIFRLVPNVKMNAVFLWQLINCKEFRPVIQAISGGSAKSMSNISKERLGKIRVICPPREIQDRLIPFMKQVDKSKSVVQESLAQSQLLFDSLMQKYFG